MPTLAVAMLLGGVVVLGLPHGAADPWVAATALRSAEGLRGRAVFVLSYLACALAVVVAWSLWPSLSLAVFLGVSAVHFGLADTRSLKLSPAGRTLTGLHRGLLPIVLPLHWHSAEVASVLEVLVGMPSGALGALTNAAGAQLFVLWCALAGLAGLTSLRESGPRSSAFEALTTLALVLIFALLPPLPAFALYFGGWHSLRHLRLIAKLFERDRFSRRALAIGGTALWAASAGLLLGTPELLAWAEVSSEERSGLGVYDPRWLQSVFIGLAALTLPHVLLTDGLAQFRGTWARAAKDLSRA